MSDSDEPRQGQRSAGAAPTSSQPPSTPTPDHPDDEVDLISDIRRQWYVVFGILFLAGAAYAIYEWMGSGQ